MASRIRICLLFFFLAAAAHWKPAVGGTADGLPSLLCYWAHAATSGRAEAKARESSQDYRQQRGSEAGWRCRHGFLAAIGDGKLRIGMWWDFKCCPGTIGGGEPEHPDDQLTDFGPPFPAPNLPPEGGETRKTVLANQLELESRLLEFDDLERPSNGQKCLSVEPAVVKPDR